MRTDRVVRALAMAALSMLVTAGSGVAQYTTEPIPEPVAFQARWSAGYPELTEAWGVDGVDPLHGIGGETVVEVVETSDPRMGGEIGYSFNDDHYRSIDLHLQHSSFRISNADGAWQESPALLLGRPDMAPTTRTGVFVGEGAYDGLVAVAEIAWDRAAQVWDVSGYIIHGDIPPLPGEGKRPE